MAVVPVAPVAPVAVDRLQWLSFDRLAPVAVVPVAVVRSTPAVAVVPVAVVPGCCLIDSSGCRSSGSSGCRPTLEARCDGSVDIDYFQKRSPVEVVLGSTGILHVIVSNQVRGKHYSVGKLVVRRLLR